MANIIKERTQDDPLKKYGKPYRESEKFYMESGINGATRLKGKGPMRIPCTINGYQEMVTLGQHNTLPTEYAQLIDDGRCEVDVNDFLHYDPDRGRAPRQADEAPRTRTERFGDYNISREHK